MKLFTNKKIMVLFPFLLILNYAIPLTLSGFVQDPPLNLEFDNPNVLENLKDSCLLGDCQTVFSIYIDNRGRAIIGNFKNGLLEGYGSIQYNSEKIFIGEFNNGFRNGKGILMKPNGSLSGVWKQDRYQHLNNDVYTGCKSGDCENGRGIYIYENYTVYIGEFKDSRASGFGVCYFDDGDIYYGEWKNHTFHGEGSYFHSKAITVQKGYWNNGYVVNNDIITPLAYADTKVEAENYGKSEIWAVVVGVAQYRHMRPLKYTDDDAYAMNAFLRSPEGGAVKKSNVKVLIDEAATKENILNALSSFSKKADKNDVFIFYFSGHGLPEALLPIDFEGENSDKQLLHKDLVKIFKASNAKSKVVIADACYSGNMMAFKGEDYETSMNNYYNEIRKNEGGLVMIMSSKAEETSIENNGLRQGIFSHFLMRGLYGAANTNDDNLIRLDELFDYVQKHVAFYTNSYQTPMIYGDKSIDLPIAVIRE